MDFLETPIIDLLDGAQSITIPALQGVTKVVPFGQGEVTSEALLTKVKCYLQGDTAQSYTSFRYKSLVRMQLKILFYADPDNDIAAQSQTIVMFPNNLYERKRLLPLSYEIPINRLYIQRIDCTLYNLTTTPLVVTTATVRRQVSEAEHYAEYTGINNNTLDEVEAYDDGFVLTYGNQTDPMTLKFIDDGQGGLAGIGVYTNGTLVKTVSFSRQSGSVPT